MWRTSAALLMVAALIPFAGCGNTAAESGYRSDDAEVAGGRQTDKPNVVVDSYALKFLVEQIAGQHVNAWFPVPAGANPRRWTPEDEMVGEIQDAELIVVQGGNYAGWVGRISLPTAKVLNVGDGLRMGDFIVVEDYTVHSHGEEGEHSHEGIAPTTWLDPALFARQAEIVAERLAETWSDHRDEFNENLQRLQTRLGELDQRVESHRAAQPLRVLTSVSDYKYLTRRLNIGDAHGHLRVWPTTEARLEDQLQKLDQRLADHPTRWMIWHIEPGSDARGHLSQRGLEIVIVPLLEQPPPEGDYFDAMENSLQRLADTVLSAETP